jgi:Subtilase family
MSNWLTYYRTGLRTTLGRAPILAVFAVAALAIAPAPASGKDGDDDDDEKSDIADQDQDNGGESGSDSGGGDSGSDDDNSGDGNSGDGSGSDDPDGDESGSSSGDGGEEDSGSSEGGESGSSGGEDGGSGDGGESGPSHGGESGSSGDGDGGESGSSDGKRDKTGSRSETRSGQPPKSSREHQSAERHASDDVFSISRNERGERIRDGEVFLVSSTPDVSARVERNGFRVIENFTLESVGLRVLRVAVPADRTERNVIDALQKADPRGLVTFNHVYGPAGTVSMATPTSRAKLDAKPMTAKIGLVDAGVDAQHPMLRDVSVVTRPFGAASAKPEQHGTAVASRIAEAAPGASILAANVFTRLPDGQEIASADAIARGLDWLAQMNVPVINLSLAGPPNPILEAMSARLVAKGHVLVAAVGNEGPQAPPQYPAAYDNVVGVTAVDAKYRVYLYANQGAYVDFAAPGVDTQVAKAVGSIETVSGTSYAAPIVTVAFARLVNKPDRGLADAALQTLESEARDLGKPGRDPIYGHGFIDFGRR